MLYPRDERGAELDFLKVEEDAKSVVQVPGEQLRSQCRIAPPVRDKDGGNASIQARVLSDRIARVDPPTAMLWAASATRQAYTAAQSAATSRLSLWTISEAAARRRTTRSLRYRIEASASG